MKMISVLKDELHAVSDPRIEGRTQHLLIDILVIGVLAVICHAETWEEIANFAQSRKKWLKQFLKLPNGIPSHDTIARVYSIIEPKELEMAFISWVKRVQADRGRKKDTICIDGKSLHGTSESTYGQSRKCLHVVSAWSTAQGIVLGQLKARGKGNAEVSAAMELIDLLDIEKMILVGDAGIGKVSIVEKIVNKKADYIFPIKSDSRRYYEDVKAMFVSRSGYECESCNVEEVGHGRKERRTVSIIRKNQFPINFNKNDNGSDHFFKLNTIGKVVYERELAETAPFTYKSGKREITKSPIRYETETRYFISSLRRSPRAMLDQLRLQWGIENQLHWSLDVNLGEDANKTRNKVAAENLAVARKIALNLVKQDKTLKVGLKSKLKQAAWDLDYLEQLLLKTEF